MSSRASAWQFLWDGGSVRWKLWRCWRRWLESQGIATPYIEPGRPWENGYGESFNSRFRDGLLNREEFASELQAKVLSAEWRQHYNERRPHSALGDLTPSEYAARASATPKEQ